MLKPTLIQMLNLVLKYLVKPVEPPIEPIAKSTDDIIFFDTYLNDILN